MPPVHHPHDLHGCGWIGLGPVCEVDRWRAESGECGAASRAVAAGANRWSATCTQRAMEPGMPSRHGQHSVGSAAWAAARAPCPRAPPPCAAPPAAHPLACWTAGQGRRAGARREGQQRLGWSQERSQKRAFERALAAGAARLPHKQLATPAASRQLFTRKQLKPTQLSTCSLQRPTFITPSASIYTKSFLSRVSPARWGLQGGAPGNKHQAKQPVGSGACSGG